MGGRDSSGSLTHLLAHPLTRGLDLDSPETTLLRGQIIRSKGFLESIYLDWYHLIDDRLPGDADRVLELGTGGGFLREIRPDLLTSEVFELPTVDLVADARRLPLADGSLSAIVMTNVFHHIPDASEFLDEASRTLRPGGRIIMVEPWNTPWSRFVHEHFHDEPMALDESWQLPETGPLSAANAALPWIVLERDRERFESDWPELRIAERTLMMPLRYVLSGGVSLRSLQPRWSYRFWKWIDERRFLRRHSLFALITIDRLA